MPFWKFLRDSVSLFPLRLLRLRQPLRLADAVSAGGMIINSRYGILKLSPEGSFHALNHEATGYLLRFEDSLKAAELAINWTCLQIGDV
jgi:hypothetical protein